MIEFSGDLTGVSKEYALKRNAKITQRFLLLMAVCSLPASYIISVAFLHNFWIFSLPALFFVTAIISGIMYKCPTRKLPTDVCIEQDKIVINYKFNSQTLDINGVKAVYDYRDFYEIIPKNKFILAVFVCQKDLLTSGTLEEFETLFEGKTVRKNKDNQDNQGTVSVKTEEVERQKRTQQNKPIE